MTKEVTRTAGCEPRPRDSSREIPRMRVSRTSAYSTAGAHAQTTSPGSRLPTVQSRLGSTRAARVAFNHATFIAVSIIACARGASAAPFAADGVALKAAVDACLNHDPTGVSCCGAAHDPNCGNPVDDPANPPRCGAAGCDEMDKWDTSLVTDMDSLFYDHACIDPKPCAYSFNADISNWDVGNVINMRYMFRHAQSFNQDLSKWNVSSVTNMIAAFSYAHAMNGSLAGWDTSKVENMGILFYAIIANGAHPRGLSTWDVSSVTNADRMFMYDWGFDEDVTMWNFPDGLPASAMDRMFSYADAWKARYTNCGFDSSTPKHAACSEFTSAGNTYSSSSGVVFGPPSAWVRMDNACDAATPPANGGIGNCSDTLVSPGSCLHSCDAGYIISGPTSCLDRTLTSATCYPDPSNCDASAAPVNGGVGDCPSLLPSGWSCQPTCDEGYIVSGRSSCSLATLTTATCRELTCCENSMVKRGFMVKHTYEEL